MTRDRQNFRERKGLADDGAAILGRLDAGDLPTDLCGEGVKQESRCLGTFPPRKNDGNMGVQQQQIATRMLFPCFIDGCGLFVDDVHYAQCDEEVAGRMQLRETQT